MKSMRGKSLVLALVLAWVGSAWAAGKPDAPKGDAWIGTWAASPVPLQTKVDEPAAGDSTYRNIVRISAGGTGLRVQLTNEFGATPLVVSAAHIAVSAGSGAIEPGSDHALTFGGRAAVTIPAGGLMLSDAVAMQAPALASLAVSVYIADHFVSTRSCHQLGDSTNYIARGDQTSAATMQSARTIDSWCFVKGVDVRANGHAFSVVTLGDSITDGYRATPDANRRWPDVLAARLNSGTAAQVGVLNEGISGNKVLRDGAGSSAIARFDRDVLAQSGVRYLIILEGINDIGGLARSQADGPSAQDLIEAMTQMVERAHQHGIKVYGATVTPYEGAGYFSAQGEQVRTALNTWMRSDGVVDGVVDFDKATRDPARPTWFLPAYDSGDHLHPNDAGYKAMADSIDLTMLR